MVEARHCPVGQEHHVDSSRQNTATVSLSTGYLARGRTLRNGRPVASATRVDTHASLLRPRLTTREWTKTVAT
jgi:hypothetical protein